MSLLTYASPWTSDNTTTAAASRKRTPTMGGIPRKTVKVRPNHDSETDQYEIYKPAEVSENVKIAPDSIEDHVEKQTDREAKINTILNKITSFNTDDKLGDFNPMPYPTNITKRNSDQIVSADESVNNGVNPLMPKGGKPEFNAPLAEPKYFRASEPNTASQYSSYRTAYGREGLTSGIKEPYYAKMGISGGGAGTDKMMDRLNYMTQMLESMQMEKTNHITEEFVLYSLLGVFMIYIVDGFSRGGKYVR